MRKSALELVEARGEPLFPACYCTTETETRRRNQIELDDEMTALLQSKIPGRTSKEKRQGHA